MDLSHFLIDTCLNPTVIWGHRNNTGQSFLAQVFPVNEMGLFHGFPVLQHVVREAKEQDFSHSA
jgi:hypothetical protein